MQHLPPNAQLPNSEAFTSMTSSTHNHTLRACAVSSIALHRGSIELSEDAGVRVYHILAYKHEELHIINKDQAVFTLQNMNADTSSISGTVISGTEAECFFRCCCRMISSCVASVTWKVSPIVERGSGAPLR